MRSATRKRIGEDPDYLAWLHRQRCICCMIVGAQTTYVGSTWVEAAHTGLRGLSQKAPDADAVPLCNWHHRVGPESYHKLGKFFWDHWGLDRERVLAELHQRYTQETDKQLVTVS